MSLKINELSKRFGRKWTLRNVSFEVGEGRVFGVGGRSGSGKSALLRAIAGQLKPESGSVIASDGGDGQGGTTNEIIYLPTVTEPSRWTSIFRSGLSQTGFGGQQQLDAFHHALDRRPNVLLLDNSFCLMDRAMRNACFEKIGQAAASYGLSVVYASNNFEEILERCDHAVILTNGEISQEGPPNEIYDRPNSRAIAELTGRNNIFEARRLTSSKADIHEFQTIEGSHRLFARREVSSRLGAIDQNIFLAIRPEHISISFGASFPEDNLLKAQVSDVRFLGPSTLVGLDACGLRIEALVMRLVGLNIGDECMVGLPPDRILILDK